MKKRPTRILSILILSLLLLAACLAVGGNNEPTPAAVTSQPPTRVPQTISATIQDHPLATPASQQPAAGICGRAEGDIVVITINPDVPDPRCVIVAPDQKLEVVNNRDEVIQVSLGVFEAEINPGEESLAPLAFGEYLAPGVHMMDISPCCGSSLWLQE